MHNRQGRKRALCLANVYVTFKQRAAQSVAVCARGTLNFVVLHFLISSRQSITTWRRWDDCNEVAWLCRDDACFHRRAPSLLWLRPSLPCTRRLRRSHSANDRTLPPHTHTHTHTLSARQPELSVRPKPRQSALVCPRRRWRGATVKGTPSLSWRIGV